METGNDKEELIKLIKTNKEIVYKICNSYCYNKDDREDLAQEIVYQLWKSSLTFQCDFKFSTWMYRVALNVAISFYRKNKNANALISLNENMKDIENVEDKSDDSENEYEEKRRLLQQFIQELKELDKALIILFLEAKSYKEIAEILGLTETNVATRINRIKDKLKRDINFNK